VVAPSDFPALTDEVCTLPSARPLRVLVRLADNECRLVRAQAEKGWHIRVLMEGEFSNACSSDSYDALLVHPCDRIVGAGLGESASRVYRSLQALGTPPLVFVFAVDQHEVLETVVRLARRIPFEVATVWRDGRIEGLRSAVQSAAASRTSMQVVYETLRSRSAGLLDPRLVSVLSDLFRRPRSYARVDRAIALHNLTVTSINAMLSRAGLRSFEYQRRAARAALAFELMGRCGFSVSHTAKRVGCGSVDTLTRDVRKVSGLTPTEFARTVEPIEAFLILNSYINSDPALPEQSGPVSPRGADELYAIGRKNTLARAGSLDQRE